MQTLPSRIAECVEYLREGNFVEAQRHIDELAAAAASSTHPFPEDISGVWATIHSHLSSALLNTQNHQSSAAMDDLQSALLSIPDDLLVGADLDRNGDVE